MNKVLLFIVALTTMAVAGYGQSIRETRVPSAQETVMPGTQDVAGQERAEVLLETTEGNIRLALYNETPLHRDNFIKLVRMQVYDSLLFHRVVKDFMIQAGDLNSKHALPGQRLGTGELDYTIEPEFRLPDIVHRRGSLAAAREADDINPEKRSGACQFYIVWDNASHLDGHYTVFGVVLEGLEVVDKIQQMPTDRFERPLTDIRILRATISKDPFANPEPPKAAPSKPKGKSVRRRR